jgi:hypothetical protein
MARPAGQARPNPTEAARESLTVAFAVSSGSCRSSVSFPVCVIGLVLEIIHSRFGDGPGRGVAKSGVSPRQGRLNHDAVSRATAAVVLVDRPDETFCVNPREAGSGWRLAVKRSALGPLGRLR